LFVIE